ALYSFIIPFINMKLIAHKRFTVTNINLYLYINILLRKKKIEKKNKTILPFIIQEYGIEDLVHRR
ncbi:hypothetical protein QHH03_28685, partial [Aphanizomenon sp. 202]|nr:hypothetical protein [Aphanizomenon sp. 202]